MMLGGYQKIDLSPADLTASTLRLDGLSKACAGANGKAALIKMPGGAESFGAVEETESGFVISTMGSDSKFVNVNVDDDDDSFTLLESEALILGKVGGSASPVTLDTTYTIAAPFIVPADGYIRIENTSTSVDTTTSVAIPYYDRTNGLPLFWGIPAGSSTKSRREAFFVKKGTPISVPAKAANTTVVFIAIVNE